MPEDLRRRYLREGLWTDDTLGGLVDGCARARAALEFRIWSERRPFTSRVGDVHAQARRLAAGLRARGLGPGDVVAFQLPNWAEAAATFFGLSMLGAVLVPVVHSYGARELGFILRESRARALITTDRFGRLDYAATLATLRPSLPDLELVVMVAAEGGRLPAGIASFAEVASSPRIDGPLAVDPDSPTVIAYTSGTTAEPKGVIHTHRSLLAEIRQLAAIQPAGDRPGLIGAPVAHAIGMLGGLLLPLYRGRAIHLTDVWRPAAVLEAMRAANLTAGSGATVFLTSLLDAPGFTAADAARIEHVGLGSAPVPVAVTERAEALGIGVARVYGSTEHPSITGSLPHAPRDKRNRTDGCALAGVELRLVDADGRDVAPGEAGEIWSRGPDLCAGYTDPALTRAAFDDAGWFASGDIGVLDADGYLTITDRKKDIIIRGGANISAAEIEELLAAMPGVAEVVVVAAPDARLGEHACAFVRRRPGRDGARPRRHPPSPRGGRARPTEVARGAARGRRLPAHALGKGQEVRAAGRPASGARDAEGSMSVRLTDRRGLGRSGGEPYRHLHLAPSRRRADRAAAVVRRARPTHLRERPGRRHARRARAARPARVVPRRIRRTVGGAPCRPPDGPGTCRHGARRCSPASPLRSTPSIAAFRTPRAAMPAATRAHYEVKLATIEIVPDQTHPQLGQRATHAPVARQPTRMSLATAKRCHVPGSPFSACCPRSSNRMPEPATRSLTVLDTSTSSGTACAAIRAPVWTAMPPILPPVTSHSPVCTPARTVIPSVRTSSMIARAQRTARAGPSKLANNPSPAASTSCPRKRVSWRRAVA